MATQQVLVGCAYFAVTRWMVIVLRLGIKASRLTSGLDVSQMASAMRWLAGKADAYCKVDVARRQTGCAERCQCLLYKTAEDLVLTISGLARYNVVAAIIREMAYNKCVAGQPEAEGRQHAHGRMTFWNLHVTVGRSARPHSVISHNDTLISLVSIIYLLTIPLYTLGIIF